jgi:hypothetical protein
LPIKGRLRWRLCWRVVEPLNLGRNLVPPDGQVGESSAD